MSRPIIWGTAHFVSMHAATSYYRPYFGSWAVAARAVQDKVRSREIHIGKPKLKQGERIVMLDHGTRYGVQSAS